MNEIKLSPIEVAMIETETWDLKRLCEIYGVPAELIEGKPIYASFPESEKPKDE